MGLQQGAYSRVPSPRVPRTFWHLLAGPCKATCFHDNRNVRESKWAYSSHLCALQLLLKLLILCLQRRAALQVLRGQRGGHSVCMVLGGSQPLLELGHLLLGL